MYRLYAVLVHSGFSCNSGHYYCYVKAPNSAWYEMNDSRVSEQHISPYAKLALPPFLPPLLVKALLFIVLRFLSFNDSLNWARFYVVQRMS